MSIDWTVSIGTILHLLGMLAALAVVYARLSVRLAVLEQRVSMLFDWWIEHQVDGGNAGRPSRPHQ